MPDARTRVMRRRLARREQLVRSRSRAKNVVERLIARAALQSGEALRLMTVPGVNVICAATFLAAVGDIRRFGRTHALVGYQRIRARRGHAIVIVAVARKLAALFWCCSRAARTTSTSIRR
jgi:transposase